jgi:Lon protease-like protein
MCHKVKPCCPTFQAKLKACHTLRHTCYFRTGPHIGRMEMEITVPKEVPVMTLPNIAFFPQALLPLHIFEPRYRQMLRDVLATNRIFAIAGLDQKKIGLDAALEPAHRIAGIGMVRACQKNEDGTSNLLLQGLCRVEISGIVTDAPYRRIRIRALSSEPGAPTCENERLRAELVRLISLKLKLESNGARELASFLKTVADPETFVDIAAFNLCDNPALKQKLLATLDVHRRLKLFSHELRAEIDTIKLRRKLQGGLADERISDN